MCRGPVPGGLVAVAWVPESTVNFVAAAAPKLTAVAPVSLLPVMTTRVPPPVGPRAGETLVTETEDDGGTEDGGGAMVPVPLRAMSCGCREEIRPIRKSAVRDPDADGVKTTVMVQVCACGTARWHGGGCAPGWVAWPPRRAVSGRVGGRTEKSCRPGPSRLIRVMVAGELP